MGSFSIRDILNLPEDRIRSLNSKSEEQMSFQDRSYPPQTLSSPDEPEANAPETAKSSMNYFSVHENFFMVDIRAPYSKTLLKKSSTTQEISRLS